MEKQSIWVRLEREITGSWIEFHVPAPKMSNLYLFAFLEGYCRQQLPGWELVTYCVPEAQGADGRPADIHPDE